MTSRLHKPITGENERSNGGGQNSSGHGASLANYGDNRRGSYEDYGQRTIDYPYSHAVPSQFTEQAREMPMPSHANEAARAYENDADPQLSSTVADLYEDHAPTEFRRTWNGELADAGHSSSPPRYQGQAYHSEQQVGGMRNPMMPAHNGHDVYSPAPPVGPSAAGNLGRHTQTVECPWCHQLVSTRIKRRIGAKAGGAAILVAVIAWPLFWVPLVVPGLHRKTHYCPSCNRRIGRGRRNA